jgi:hypothetical protein
MIRSAIGLGLVPVVVLAFGLFTLGAGCAQSTAGSMGAPPGSGGNGAIPEPGGGATPAVPDPWVSTCHPEQSFTGAPIDAPADQWTWVPFAGARCRDGSSTGIGIRLHPGATGLVVYFEGGGACFHDVSCLVNDVLQSFGATQFSAWAAATGAAGIFDPARDDNPLRGWSFVYVPYCTGDVHAGSRDHVDVPGGPTNQSFVGYRNVAEYLQRVVPTFKDVRHVVATGISAGGFGAAFNYDRLAQAFCGSRVTLVDDSGPPMGDAYLAPCLQRRWRELWNLDASLPADCKECRGADGGGIVNYVSYLTNKYPDADLGLVSADQDSIISLFFGYGANECAGLTGASAGMSGAKFRQGLAELRDQYFSRPNLGSYIVPSVSHTFTTALTFYSTTVDGMTLPAWMNYLVNEKLATHVGLP